MKTRTRETKTTDKKSKVNSASEQNLDDAAKFHDVRLSIHRTTENIRQFANRPTGNDEMEQSIAENVDSNMIAETAYLMAEKRDFAPGNARSDWLKAESRVEDVLNSDFIDRRNATLADRRNAATSNRRSAGEQPG